MDDVYTFTIPAGMNRTDDVLALHKYLQDSGKSARIEAYDGVQGLQWNGGRMTFNHAFVPEEKPNFPAPSLSLRDIDQAIEKARLLNEAGIPFNIIFNSRLGSVDTDDDACNYLLQALHHEMNGVTVASEILRRHISANYPKYALTASICYAYAQPEQYQDLCGKYDKVVMMPLLAYEPNRLEGLPWDKLVFIINDNCNLFCPRTDHYDYISRCSLYGNITVEEQEFNLPKAGCFLTNAKYKKEALKRYDPKVIEKTYKSVGDQLRAEGIPSGHYEANFNITPPVRRELMRRGVRTFKLQGREYPTAIFHERVTHFLEKIVREDL